MRLACIILLCCLLSCLSYAADGPASFSREDVAKYAPTITLQLRSGSELAAQKAVETIRDIANHSSRDLSDNLPTWIDPLLECHRYDEVLELTQLAIIDRGFDISTVEKLEEARVQALLGKGELDRALSEGRAYYSVCLLKSTPHATDLLCSILERQGKSVVASQLRIEQINGPSTRPTTQTASGEGFENGLPTTSVLAWIAVDATPWEQTVNGLDAGHTFNDFMKRGNLALLTDKPELARKCFESACQMTDGASKKNTREAIEGIARCIRDMPDGTPALADNFITNLRHTPEIAGMGLASNLSMDDLRTAAQQTVLVPLQVASAPPLEQRRIKEESSVSSLTSDSMKITSNFETAIPLEAHRLSPTHFELTRATADGQNWFIFSVEGASGKTIRIDIYDPNKPLGNWVSMNPVYCNGPDLNASDFYSTTVAKDVENPVMPWNSHNALLPNTTGQKWHYIPDVWRADPNTIAVVRTIDSDRTFVAMRVPLPPSYNDRFLYEIGSNSYAKMIEIGKSQQGRPLSLMRIGTGDEKAKPCIMLYAGEHADEYDAMWVARGAIEFLSGNSDEARRLRDQFTFIIIPVLDPDASAAGRHSGMYLSFVSDSKTTESIAYANWFQNWVNDGKRLDLVFDLHNVQSLESGHVACALAEGTGERGKFSEALNSALVSGFREIGLVAAQNPWDRGWSPDRLGGWLSRRYGALCLCYEVNSQAADRHLNLAEVKDLGRIFISGACKFLSASDGAQALANIDARRQERIARWGRQGSSVSKLDAISAEAVVSKGVGIATDNANTMVEKWVP